MRFCFPIVKRSYGCLTTGIVKYWTVYLSKNSEISGKRTQKYFPNRKQKSVSLEMSFDNVYALRNKGEIQRRKTSMSLFKRYFSAEKKFFC